MVFLGEGVPLEENILKTPKEFVKTWLEWSADNREQIFRTLRNQAGGGAFRLFEVPKGNTLFITNTFISHSGDTTGFTSSQVTILPRNIDLIAVQHDGTASVPNTNTSSSLAFPMPIKVNEGETIDLFAGINLFASGGIIGFLVPRKIA